jgi:hypothetical protein
MIQSNSAMVVRFNQCIHAQLAIWEEMEIKRFDFLCVWPNMVFAIQGDVDA